MSRKQLIAVDGSEQAQYAFDWYLENFYKPGDHVYLVHCAEYNINMGLPGTHDVKTINEICEAVKKRNDEIYSLTDDFMNVLRQRKIASEVMHLSGDKPGEAIVKAAAEKEVGHIIMGTRGLGRIRRTVLGSVSEYVIHHCGCPVTVVRKPGEPQSQN